MALDARPITSNRDLNTFIKLPWRLYRNERNWVPPLLFERKRFFNRARNPFFEHAEAEYFLAWRDGRAVGRLTAHVDRHFSEFHHHDWGMFGFFECEQDPEAAGALLAAAEAWLRQRGREPMVGPMDFTTNDECGQHTGIAARFYEMHFEAAARTPGAGGEMGWILETNKSMNRAMERMGGRIVRTYRVYEKIL